MQNFRFPNHGEQPEWVGYALVVIGIVDLLLRLLR
jgi:hypothetical protein